MEGCVWTESMLAAAWQRVNANAGTYILMGFAPGLALRMAVSVKGILG